MTFKIRTNSLTWSTEIMSITSRSSMIILQSVSLHKRYMFGSLSFVLSINEIDEKYKCKALILSMS